ncbi:hypothetical protein Angca_000650, partial [Angiostrongylus cantonensis]
SASSTEILIDSCGWLSMLRCTLERLLEEGVQNLLVTVKVVHSEEVAKMLLKSIEAVCPALQNSILMTVFYYVIVVSTL